MEPRFHRPGPRPSADPTYIVVRDRASYPFRLGVWALRALFHVKNVRGNPRISLQGSALSETVQRNPRFAFKFLTGEYLARGLSVSECAPASFTLQPSARAASQHTAQILEEEVTLHTFHEEGGRLPHAGPLSPL